MKILTADDHSTVRIGLRYILKQLGDDVTTVEACNFEEVLDVVEQDDDLDLIVIDLLMPGMDWARGLRALHAIAPNIPIVVFSMIRNRGDILRAIDLGAVGFVAKTASGDEIIRAVKSVTEGEIYLPRELLSKPQTPAEMSPGLPIEGDLPSADAIRSLTKRQREVLKLLRQGKSNAEIASILGRSEHTVRIHVSAILKALEVPNRTMAALIAKECAPGFFE
ncbi:MAG: response regulator [Sphingomonadales bacterium]